MTDLDPAGEDGDCAVGGTFVCAAVNRHRRFRPGPFDRVRRSGSGLRYHQLVVERSCSWNHAAATGVSVRNPDSAMPAVPCRCRNIPVPAKAVDDLERGLKAICDGPELPFRLSRKYPRQSGVK